MDKIQWFAKPDSAIQHMILHNTNGFCRVPVRREDKRVTIDGKNHTASTVSNFRKSWRLIQYRRDAVSAHADMTKMSVHLYKAICTNPTDSESSYDIWYERRFE